MPQKILQVIPLLAQGVLTILASISTVVEIEGFLRPPSLDGATRLLFDHRTLEIYSTDL
jgi:hypothetical protein